MAPSHRNRRPDGKPRDEIMELNTGDVIPLFDDELELLEDDKLSQPLMPVVMSPVSEMAPARVLPRPASKSSLVTPRRPRKESPEALETLVTTSLSARDNGLSNAGFSEAFLYVEKGPGAGQLVPVLQGNLVIGRSSECELQLNHPSVSRKHAALSRRGEQYYLSDAGSQNGTYVNWAKISGEVEVFPGDQVSVGSAVLVLRGGVYTSAMRRGSTAGQGAAPASNSNKWLAPAVVFGGALVGVVAMVLFWGHKTVVPVPTPAVAAVAKPAAPAVQAPPPVTKPEAALAKIAAQPVANPPAEQGQPEVDSVKVSSVAEVPLSRHERAHKKSERRERRVASAAPAPASSDAPPAVLKIYESGDVQGAIAAAEQAGAGRLAAKMKQFDAAYQSGKDALANQNGGGAVSGFTRALKLDQSIDSGWGKLNGEVRGELAKLYVLAGNQALGRGDKSTAQKAFKAAVGFQPSNSQARAKLRQLKGGSSSKPAANPRAAADAAFDS